MTTTQEPMPTTAPAETDVQLVFTVRVRTYGHPEKVRASVARDLERILQLAFHDRATVDAQGDEHSRLRSALVAARAELDRHGYGDFHYTGPDYRDQSVLDALSAIDDALQGTGSGSHRLLEAIDALRTCGCPSCDHARVALQLLEEIG